MMVEKYWHEKSKKIERKHMLYEDGYKYDYDCGVEPMPLLLLNKPLSDQELATKFISGFRDINEKLEKVTVEVTKEYMKLAKMYMRGDIFLWDTDLEVSVLIKGHVGELDPLYREDADNILVTLESNMQVARRNLKIHPFGIELNEKDHCTIREFDCLNHCYVFHALYDHTDLDLMNILRIESFGYDIKLHAHSNSIQVK
ncbi:hypothetical protein [Francisella sp. SYW-9]|uniref:hypothetical protein n=1 Tax=Francisella sp. SYW-9 TaxID=2610888 RepID=UPI00123D2C02|nr:hypothetical protein [Francisella sp. SYW-9]